MLRVEPRKFCRISELITLQQWDRERRARFRPTPCRAHEAVGCPGGRRALPAGLVLNSSWLLHSGLQEALPDPQSLAACRSPEQLCVTSCGTAEPHQHPQQHPGPIPQHNTPVEGGMSLPTWRSQQHTGSLGPIRVRCFPNHKGWKNLLFLGHWPQRNGAPCSLHVKRCLFPN